MKLTYEVIANSGYREYIGDNSKSHIASFEKVIDNVKVVIEAHKSIRGGVNYRISYYYFEEAIYIVNTKELNLYIIEEIAATINRSFSKQEK